MLLGLPGALLPRVAAAAESAPAPPRAFAQRIAAMIADTWSVPAASMRLEWGRVSGEVRIAAGDPYRLLGHGTGGWFVVVLRPGSPGAVALQVRAGVERRVPVATRALRAGKIASASDVREELRVHWGAPPDAGDGIPVEGWRVRRAIGAGEVLAWPMVEPPPLIEAGEPVKIAWRREGVQVTLTGVALNSAGRGESVSARVENRPARIVARVTGRGTAELPGGSR